MNPRSAMLFGVIAALGQTASSVNVFKVVDETAPPFIPRPPKYYRHPRADAHKAGAWTGDGIETAGMTRQMRRRAERKARKQGAPQ